MTDRPHDKPWAGSRDIQETIADDIMQRHGNNKPLDLMGAFQTLLANMVCDLSRNHAMAVDGLAACVGDMREVIDQRFPKKVS